MPLDLFDLTGRSALVTGGSKGLGLAMAKGFAAAGADLAIASRNESELHAAAEAIRAVARPGATVAPLVADLARRGEADRLAAGAAEALGKVDILINNAGSNTPQPIEAIRDEDWDRLVELNLSSCMALARALAPGMIERRWGRIVHISSIMGLTSAAGRDVYSATKSALIGLARAGAVDLGPHGITVNCLAPGPFLTDLPMNLLSAEQKDAMARRTALGRWGDPDELVGPALLLASEAGRYITGETLVVDGGLMAKVF